MKGEIRKNFVISNLAVLEQGCQELYEQGKRITAALFNEQSKLKGGTRSAALTDMKILGLAKNGSGVEFSDECVAFLKHKGEQDYLKALFLKVPYFKELEKQGVNDYVSARKFIFEKIKDHYKKSTAKICSNSAARRYAEIVLDKPLQKAEKVIENENIGKMHALFDMLSYEEQKALVKFLLSKSEGILKPATKEKLIEKLIEE